MCIAIVLGCLCISLFSCPFYRGDVCMINVLWCFNPHTLSSLYPQFLKLYRSCFLCSYFCWAAWVTCSFFNCCYPSLMIPLSNSMFLARQMLNDLCVNVTLYPLVSLIFFILQERGAHIYAEFLGGSFTCDAYHVTEPRPDGNMLFH